MEDEKSLEVASILEDLLDKSKTLIAFTQDLMSKFSETGLLTVETKKDFDLLLADIDITLKDAEAILDPNEGLR